MLRLAQGQGSAILQTPQAFCGAMPQAPASQGGVGAQMQTEYGKIKAMQNPGEVNSRYLHVDSQGDQNKRGPLTNLTDADGFEVIGRSLGARAKSLKVKNLITGEDVNLAEGTGIEKQTVIAGKGRNRQIDCIDRLLDEYHGDMLEWKKMKGLGYIEDAYGELKRVELHWYEEPTVGKVEVNIKIQRDGTIYVEKD